MFRYYSPKFEADKYNPAMLRYAPWAGHRAFAYDYVMNRRPSCIVELGSHYGCSAFAFLQAMKDGGINGSFYAVDTWEGDSFTKNDYREDICGQYKEIQDACFSGQDSSSGPDAHMLRMTFDEASRLFADASIDLLHIDGSHLYEDVKHDFLTWKSKVRRDGAIFFHDIAEEEMFGEVLGSHVFWKELKEEYSLTLEFPFSLGLGVLFFDEEIYRTLRDGVSVEHYQLLANHADNKNRDVLRENFFRIRDLEEYRDSLKKQVGLLNEEIARKTAGAITAFACAHGADVIVFEHLEMQGAGRGKNRQKLHMWKKQEVQKIVEHHAHRVGIRVSRVNARKTSALAYDGSGPLERDPGNHALSTFSSGKQYNCDLSASYNIGARYYIRELLKPASETERSALEAKVPAVQRRTSCVYADLLALNTALAETV